jgi:hypothetical protein
MNHKTPTVAGVRLSMHMTVRIVTYTKLWAQATAWKVPCTFCKDTLLTATMHYVRMPINLIFVTQLS